MAQQEGPFSSYLDYMQKPIAPAPTGLEGTGMGIANIAMNFLQGLRQGRAQQYIRSEKEEERKEQLLLNAMQIIQRSDMLPEDKAQYEARIQQEFAKRVAGVKEGSKDTGNPLTDFFKRAGMALVGGQPPGGKKADIDMNVALEAFAAASDPSRSKTRFIADLDRQADELIRGGMQEAASKGRAASYETFFSGDRGAQLNALIDKARRLGAPLPAVEKTRSEYRVLTQQDIDRKDRADRARAIEIDLDRTGRQPTMTELSILHLAKGLPPVFASHGDVYEDKEGNRFTGYTVQSPYLSAGEPVVVNLTTRQRVEAPRKLSPAEAQYPSKKELEESVAPFEKAISEVPGLPKDQADNLSSMLRNAASVNDRRAMIQIQSNAVNIGKDFREKLAEQKAKDVADKARLNTEMRSRLADLFKTVTQNDKYKWNSIANGPAKQALLEAKNPNLSPIQRAESDILLIRAIAKMTDITTGVREGEYKTFQDLLTRHKELALKVKNLYGPAKVTLTPEARAGYVSILEGLINNTRSEYEGLLGETKQKAIALGLDPKAIDRVYQTGKLEDYSPVKTDSQSEGAGAGTGTGAGTGRGAVVSPRSPVVKQPNPFRK